MNPSVPELLVGALMTISEPPPPESAGEFAGGRIGVIGMISFLAAQEVESGIAVRVAESRSLRALFADAAREAWAPALTSTLTGLAAGTDDDLTLTGVDRANGILRSALIELQSAVEADPAPAGRARELRIARLLLDHARARALMLPGQPR